MAEDKILEGAEQNIALTLYKEPVYGEQAKLQGGGQQNKISN
jgi:hypothetical protein